MINSPGVVPGPLPRPLPGDGLEGGPGRVGPAPPAPTLVPRLAPGVRDPEHSPRHPELGVPSVLPLPLPLTLLPLSISLYSKDANTSRFANRLVA